MLWKQHKMRGQHKEHNVSSKMSKIFIAKCIGVVMILALMLGNIVVFAKSVHLSDNISLLEHDITEIRKENEYLQKKMYAESSLTSLAYSAEQLGFTKQAEPVFFEKPNYAMAQ
jgi:cell division protein FtsL